MIVIDRGGSQVAIPQDAIFLLNLRRTVYEMTVQEMTQQWNAGEITLHAIHETESGPEWVFLPVNGPST